MALCVPLLNLLAFGNEFFDCFRPACPDAMTACFPVTVREQGSVKQKLRMPCCVPLVFPFESYKSNFLKKKKSMSASEKYRHGMVNW